MTIDERIQQIMNKMEHLSTKDPEYPCGEFPPKWGKPLSLSAVEQFEHKNGIQLPKDYKRFITTVAASCSQPFYGLYSPVGKLPSYETRPDVSKKFLYTLTCPLDMNAISEETYKKIFETEEINVDTGYILLCTEGCGMLSILVVNTDDPDTYGTVWFYDLCNDAGIFPLKDPATQRPMSFLDWLEYYVDQMLALDDENFFSYGSLAFLPDSATSDGTVNTPDEVPPSQH